MGRKNPLEKALDHITDDYQQRLKSAKASNAVPLGVEEVTPREFRSRFAGMTEFERKQTLDTLGAEAVLKNLRGGK